MTSIAGARGGSGGTLPPRREDSASALREFNRQRVLAAVRELEAASRADLERVTGLSRGTVASIVVELQREGILRPVGGQGGAPDSPEEPRDSQRATLGRPPALVAMAAPTGLALVADVGHAHVRVAVGDAEGTLPWTTPEGR
jgi:hypothetical protein